MKRIVEIAEKTKQNSFTSARMSRHVLIGGGSGFIGQAITRQLRQRGDRVTWISRTPGRETITWGDLARAGLQEEYSAVINLAGQHILDPRRKWNSSYREEVLRSRVDTTQLLVDAINNKVDKPEVFVSVAGKCFYGTNNEEEREKLFLQEHQQQQNELNNERVEGVGNDRTTSGIDLTRYPVLDETSSPMGMDFPATLVGEWEKAADHLCSSVRHVRLRIGIVLGQVHRESFWGRLWRIGGARGVLPLIRLPFCLGLGCTIGSGKQPFPWIHVDDMSGIAIFVVDHNETQGRYNCVAPGIVTNEEFTQAFARHLHRPVVWNAPASLVKALVGEERSSILLEGQNVHPTRTMEAGYVFKYPTINVALGDLVKITF